MLFGITDLKKAPWRSLFFLWLIFLALPVQAAGSAIASAHPLATQAGMKILDNGGNAFDAAITVSSVLAVVEPYGSGFGGGGFWLLHRELDNRQVMIDGREKAPLSAHRDMYLDENGEVIANASVDGALAAGIPGMPAALVYLSEKYGQLPLHETLQPAIDIAQKGFPVEAHYQQMARFRLAALQSSFAAKEIFLQDDMVPELGYVIRQPDLAKTIAALASGGFDGFYRGEVARQLVDGVQAAGGIWTMQDLAQYQVVERVPVRFSYKDKTIVSASLPSSGGIVMAQIFNMLATFDLDNLSATQQVQVIVEAMRRAYKDRAEYLGDQDFIDVPVGKLLNKNYAQQLASDIQLNRAGQSKKMPVQKEGQDTSHFSIIDKAGNRVAATLSINYPFGSGFVAEGTGVLLNDEMDDFSSSPGVPNVYGLVGSDANAIEPAKRMLSSMSPTFVESDTGIAVLGTPGGSRIITMVLLAILEMEKSNDPQQWVELPRYHHQYLPDVIQYEENAFSDELANQLSAMGYRLKKLKNRYGNMQAIFKDNKTGELKAASDKRGIGQAMVR